MIRALPWIFLVFVAALVTAAIFMNSDTSPGQSRGVREMSQDSTDSSAEGTNRESVPRPSPDAKTPGTTNSDQQTDDVETSPVITEDTVEQEQENESRTSEPERLINLAGPVGSMNHEILQSSRFTRLVLEVDAVSSETPSDAAVDWLVSTIQHYSEKPEGVVQAGGNTFSGPTERYTNTDIARIISQHRSQGADGKSLSLHIVYLNGSYAENENALGLAFNATTIVIFPERINDALTALVSGTQIEISVLIHEFGHLLGLVNITYQSDRAHEDPAHPHHSSNQNSVMYWAVEDISVANLLRGGPPSTFDADDEHDIAMIRNGAW